MSSLYTLSLHDALTIFSHSMGSSRLVRRTAPPVSLIPLRLPAVGTNSSTLLPKVAVPLTRSEEHTSELQSPCNLVCRLLLEKIILNRTLPSQYGICC